MNVSENPKYSIIVPNYNYGRYLGDAIKSLLSQTFTNWEAILIDDCSTDNSKQIIETINDPRIKKIFHKSNVGNVSTFNEGIQNSTGMYVVILSADDAYSEKFLEMVDYFFLENPDAVMVYTDFHQIDSNGTVKKEIKNKNHEKGGLFEEEISYLLYTCHIPHCAAVVNRVLLLDLGMYNPSFPRTCDWDLWLRIAIKWPIGYINEALYYYRIHKNNMSTAVETQLKIISETELILDNFFSHDELSMQLLALEPKIRNYHKFQHGLRCFKSGALKRGYFFLVSALTTDFTLLFNFRNMKRIIFSFLRGLFYN